ncbi:MAG: anaerobic sulfatase maturase [Planctomycetota bacterium]
MSDTSKQLESVLIKPAGPDCNLACTYCFYLEKEKLFPRQRVHRMSAEVLETLVRQVMSAGRQVTFAWQGGEPTLMGLDFYRQAVELQEQYGCPGQVVGNGLQTNGLLINDDWARFLHEARFLVGLSIDGPEHVHDRYRVTGGGQPTWQRVYVALKRLLTNGVEVNALTVVNEYSARFPREIYEFHKVNGLKHMQFIPCLEPDPVEPARAASFSVQPRQLADFLCKVFDCWRADFRNGEPTTFVRWFDALFATYVGINPPECTLSPECGNYVVVEHNGDVFSCDFFVEARWRLGNVLNGELTEMLNSPRQTEFGQAKADLAECCQECRWLAHCRGGCPKERWGHPAGEAVSYFCAAYQAFLEHTDAQFRKLADNWQAERRLAEQRAPMPPPVARTGRNDPCPCGSGLKYKHCCDR